MGRFHWPSALFVLLMSSLIHAQAPATREHLHEIENYVVFYGIGELEALLNYDLAIIQPDTLTAEELTTLKENGTLVVAYLSIGEAEPYRTWFDEVDPAWIIGENENWDSLFIDASQTGWQALMLEQAGIYLDQGFDGIFLDTVDTAAVFPETQVGMESLITQLRDTYPEAILIQNRGFTVLPATGDIIDALMFEDLTTSYDFQEEIYIHIDNTDFAETLQEIQAETGIVILALDYAAVGDIETQTNARAVAESFGFISAVAEISLQVIIE